MRTHRGRRFWQGNPYGLPDQVVVFNAPDEDKACSCKGGNGTAENGLSASIRQNPLLTLAVAALVGYLVAKR